LNFCGNLGIMNHRCDTTEKILDDQKADPKLKSRIERILPTVDIEDNLILIVGKLRM